MRLQQHACSQAKRIERCCRETRKRSMLSQQVRIIDANTWASSSWASYHNTPTSTRRQRLIGVLTTVVTLVTTARQCSCRHCMSEFRSTLWMGIRVVWKFRVEFFEFQKIQILENVTRRALEINRTRKFGYPTIRVRARVYRTTRFQLHRR